jgi:hypothetical protein
MSVTDVLQVLTGAAPMSLDTENLSMYSLISTRVMALSV